VTVATQGRDVEDIERALTTIFRWGNLPRVRERFARQAGVTLDRAAYGLLARLRELGPLRLSELAEHAGVDVSTASRQVLTLEKKGLVLRQSDPEDGRASRLALTQRGSTTLAKVRSARRQFLAVLLDDWTLQERSQLATLLGRLAEDLVSLGRSET
jgi:DNA-binding MarR family transcriptional regulator